MELNTVVLAGNLTRDPKTKTIPSGSVVCNFSLALNRKWGGNEEVCYIDCEAWGRTAEFIQQYFRKGKALLVQKGRFKQERWQDKDSGQNRSKIVVVVEFAGFTDQARQDGQDEQSQDGQDEQRQRPSQGCQPSRPSESPPSPSKNPAGLGSASARNEAPIGSEDLPF